MNFSLFITGCQYNYYDATKITRLLSKMGYLYTRSETDADIIVVLACAVRQKPMDRIYGKLKIWKNSKKNPKIIIVGCILPNDRKKLIEKNINIVSIDNIKDVILNLFQDLNEIPNQVRNDYLESYQEFTPQEAQLDTAYIPIMQGCNNYCTYCAVPYTRGREKSRKPEEIISEIKEELSQGKKHIMLLGQNVNSYKLSVISNKPLDVKSKSKQLIANSVINKSSISDFAKLLKQIDKISGDFDYNFLSANPRNFSDELIQTLPKLKKWKGVLHIPLQSGDDKILKKMNRKYSSQQYSNLISSIKSRVSNLELSTDIIVGFPGETKKQFENTVTFCKKIGFSKAYVNQYSPRPGTFAAKNYPDDVPASEKKRRWTILNDLINK